MSNSWLLERALERQRGALEAGLDALGHADLRSARRMASTAAPSDAPGARLKETVTTGNWSWCAMASVAGLLTIVATAFSGTCWPPLAGHVHLFERGEPVGNSGACSSTTRYWSALGEDGGD